MKTCLLFAIVGCLLAESARAQSSMAKQEAKLAQLYAKLFSFARNDYDSVRHYTDLFERTLWRTVCSEPTSLRYPFQQLIDSALCSIQTSADGKLRIYSWDTWLGGTQHAFKIIYQWEDGGKVYAQKPKFADGDPGSICDTLYTLHDGKKTTFLGVFGAVHSTRDVVKSAVPFRIQGSQLNDTLRLFQTKRARLSRIDVAFDFFSVVNRPERPLQIIQYNDKKKVLYIPVVSAGGKVTDRHLVYAWQNGIFVYSGVQKRR